MHQWPYFYHQPNTIHFFLLISFSLLLYHKTQLSDKIIFFLCLLAKVNCQSWQFTVAKLQKNLPLTPLILGTKLEFEVVKQLFSYFTTNNGDTLIGILLIFRQPHRHVREKLAANQAIQSFSNQPFDENRKIMFITKYQ